MVAKVNSLGRLITRVGRHLLAITLIALPLLNSCNELKEWRDSQIQTSHNLADAGMVHPPATPIKIPAKVTNQLPWSLGFVVTTYTSGRGNVTITAISPDDTLQTTKWMLGKLSAMGYESGDNASRILEGVEYTNLQATYGRLFVKVTMNVHEQCIIELRGYEIDAKGRPSR